jgi:hypothetical protein
MRPKISKLTGHSQVKKIDKNKKIVLKMNSEFDALSFYLTYVFTMDPEGKLTYCKEIWPFLIYFLTNDETVSYYNAEGAGKFKVKGYRRIKTCFLDIVTNNWGSAMYTTDKIGRLILKLKFDEVPITIPSMTRDFSLFADIRDCAFGISKLAMRREVPIKGLAIPYYHVGMTLRRADGGLDLAEVRVDILNARVEVRDCLQVVNENPIKQYIIDNRSIVHKGNINPIKTLFRLSKIIGKRISYGLLSFNCDHIANYLFTAQIEWTTKVWELPESHAVPQFPMGDIHEDHLLEIESHIISHENIKLASGSTQQ